MNFQNLFNFTVILTRVLTAYDEGSRGEALVAAKNRRVDPLAFSRDQMQPLWFREQLGMELAVLLDCWHGHGCVPFNYTLAPKKGQSTDGSIGEYQLTLDIPMLSLGICLQLVARYRWDGVVTISEITVVDDHSDKFWQLEMDVSSQTSAWPKEVKDVKTAEMLTFLANFCCENYIQLTLLKTYHLKYLATHFVD